MQRLKKVNSRKQEIFEENEQVGWWLGCNMRKSSWVLMIKYNIFAIFVWRMNLDFLLFSAPKANYTFIDFLG